VYFVLSWFAVGLTLSLKLGPAADAIYAEDGAIYLQEAIDFTFPKDFLLPYAGYTDITARALGNFVSLFPLEQYTIAILLSVSLVLTLTGFLVLFSSRETIQTFHMRILLSVGLILMPIGNFESIGNITNLHFYLMAGCLFLLVGKSLPENRNSFGVFFIVLSCLSTPLMIFYFPILFINILISIKNQIKFEFHRYHFALIVGIALQTLFIIMRAAGDRSSNLSLNVSRTIYLFFDRVVGSSVVPFWGYVSSENLTRSFRDLILRGIVGAAIFLLTTIIMIILYRKHRSQLVFPMTLVVGLLFYWLTLGLLFAPEPRYAIFAGFLFFTALIAIFDIATQGSNKTLILFFITLICTATWLGSFKPPAFRTTGPSISSQISSLDKLCRTKYSIVPIKLIPINAEWELKLHCDKIR
jgi:hypothetical protein